MRTKIVYVLCSDKNDYYLQQTYVSLLSLKKHCPQSWATLVVDTDTRKTITNERKKILELTDEIIEYPSQYKTKTLNSRNIKTQLREIVKGDFLFIDSDTVICDDLSEVDNWEESLYAVLDRHMHLFEHSVRKDINKWSAKVGWNIRRDEDYYNSGVFYVKDNEQAHTLYRLWHTFWKEGQHKGIHYDQPSLGRANQECGNIIKELDGIWNCQIMENGLQYLATSKIIHFYASNRMKYKRDAVYLLSNKDIYNTVLSGCSIELDKMMENPRNAFSRFNSLQTSPDTEILGSLNYRLVRAVYEKIPRLYKFSENVLQLIIRLIDRIK